MAGSLAAVITETSCFAIDTLNTNMKAFEQTSMRGTFLKLVREQGWRSLFKGIDCIYYGIISYSVVYFYLYSKLKRAL